MRPEDVPMGDRILPGDKCGKCGSALEIIQEAGDEEETLYIGCPNKEDETDGHTEYNGRMIEISSILSKPELTKEDIDRLQNRLSYLHNIEMGTDVGLSVEIATIARAVAFKAKVEAEMSLPEAEILPFGSGGAHAIFPKSLIGKTIKYYVQGSESTEPR